MKRRLRILVVDDSVVARRAISDLLASEPDLEVVGTAANGQIALEKAAELRPDLVTLDVEMPQLDGLETLKQLRERWPKLPVIMLSALTERAGELTLDALELGARDYVTKPSRSAPLAQVKTELVAKVRALALGDGSTPEDRDTPRAPASAPVVNLVVVAASTGGPQALEILLRGIPRPLPVSMAIVQHMPPLFTRLLARRLSEHSGLIVREAEEGMPALKGEILLAPGDRHLELRRDESNGLRAHLHDGPQENGCRPAADVLFRSAARCSGPGALAVVLTGMGSDGHLGCVALRDVGAGVIAQDASTSVVWGMPGAVVRAGLADLVLPLEHVAVALQHKVGLT
jgi:two-component system chemotaxis response regulator CheB